jgi:thiol-disulfide isomerase/thioredoxin
MTTVSLLVVAVVAGAQSPAMVGQIDPVITADPRMVMMVLKAPSAEAPAPELPRPPASDDRVWAGDIRSFKAPTAKTGPAVVLVQHADGGATLYLDSDGDGRLTAAEARPYEMKNKRGAPLDLELSPVVPHTPRIPIRAQLSEGDMKATPAVFLSYTPILRIAGSVDLAGRATKVSLPYDAPTATIKIERGEFGMDTDGNGTIDTQPLSPEVIQAAKDEPAVFRVGDKYYSIASADVAARTFTVREHPASDYRLIEVRDGAEVADFPFTDFDGKQRKLSEFRGKYVLLDFWGSWCGPCVADVPHMKDAYDRFKSRGFEIVGLDYEHGATSEKVRPFLKEKGVTWVNATPESVVELIDKRFRVTAFPTLVLLDSQGKVIERRSNRLRGAQLIKTLEEILPKQ